MMMGFLGASSALVGTTTSHPLDGLSPTGAWSMGRFLLSSYSSSLYTTTTGKIDTLFDQSGNARNMAQGSSTIRPSPTTAGPNSRDCSQFTAASSTQLVANTALSSFIGASNGYMIASIMVDTFPTNNASSYLNSTVLLDIGHFAGMTVRSGNIFYAYNWDTNEDKAQGTVNASTVYVVEWRHDGVNVYQRVNGAGETSVASGNTGTMTNFLGMGGTGAGGGYLDGKVFEAAIFSTVPSQAQRDALVKDFGVWTGASV